MFLFSTNSQGRMKPESKRRGFRRPQTQSLSSEHSPKQTSSFPGKSVSSAPVVPRVIAEFRAAIDASMSTRGKRLRPLIEQIVSETLRRPADEVRAAGSLVVLGLDSLDRVRLAHALETAIGVPVHLALYETTIESIRDVEGAVECEPLSVLAKAVLLELMPEARSQVADDELWLSDIPALFTVDTLLRLCLAALDHIGIELPEGSTTE